MGDEWVSEWVYLCVRLQSSDDLAMSQSQKKKKKKKIQPRHPKHIVTYTKQYLQYAMEFHKAFSAIWNKRKLNFMQAYTRRGINTIAMNKRFNARWTECYVCVYVNANTSERWMLFLVEFVCSHHNRSDIGHKNIWHPLLPHSHSHKLYKLYSVAVKL